MMYRPIWLLIIVYVYNSEALPQGAPTKVCETMLPFHAQGTIRPQSDPPPYTLHLSRRNGGVYVTITSSLGIPFGGFMLQARTPQRQLLGVFQPIDGSSSHTINCGDDGNTLTHSDSKPKQAVEAQWNPPVNYEGPVIFNATIAEDYLKFWVGMESKPIEISKRFTNDDPLPIKPNRNPSTTPTYFQPELTRESATDFDPFYNGCASTKLCFGSPVGCLESKNCKAIVAITVRGDSYEFEMKATGDAMWIGVGLSLDDKMGEDSVIECVRRGAAIQSYMSWTSGPPNSYGATRLKNPQLGIQLLNSSYIDGNLYCKVHRDAKTTVNGNIIDLINNKYYLLVAAGSNVQPTGVQFHDITFLASGNAQYLSDVSALAAASKLLVRLHGSFMLVAWIGTASLGILLARYYRTTWVGSSLCGKDLWFAWHRMFMVLTWTLTVVGFVLIFVELKAWSAEKNPHAILGTITTIICFLQPIGAYFRPHPGTPKRPIFNWLHWLGGNTAHIIAIVTIFFAVRLTKAELPSFMDWILVAYVVFHVVVHLVLSIMTCIADRTSERRVTSFPMKDLGGSGRSTSYPDRHQDSPYSGFRKSILAIYISVLILLVIAMVVIIALAPIEESWNILKKKMMDEQ